MSKDINEMTVKEMRVLAEQENIDLGKLVLKGQIKQTILDALESKKEQDVVTSESSKKEVLEETEHSATEHIVEEETLDDLFEVDNDEKVKDSHMTEEEFKQMMEGDSTVSNDEPEMVVEEVIEEVHQEKDLDSKEVVSDGTIEIKVLSTFFYKGELLKKGHFYHVSEEELMPEYRFLNKIGRIQRIAKFHKKVK